MNNVDIKQLVQVLQDVQNSGMSARDLFYQKAKEMGVNPDDILKMLPIQK